MLLLLATPAMAQVEVSASLDSDYRYRGISLSDGKPVLSLDISYDHSSGFYGGATGMVEGTAYDGVQPLGYIAYLGYAMPAAGYNWDVGVTDTSVTSYNYYRYTVNYTEIYAGFSKGHLNAHLFYSPDYYQTGVSTIYAEVGGGWMLAPKWRLFVHAGVLTPLTGPDMPGARRERYDTRAGVARRFKDLELRLAWTSTAPGLFYPGEGGPGRDAVVFGATYHF